MKKSFRFIAALIIICLLAGCTPAPVPVVPTPTLNLTPPTFDSLIPIAKVFVSDLSTGNFIDAFNHFDATMRSTVSATKLGDTWHHLLTLGGAFQQQTGTRTQFIQGRPVVSVTCDFANGTLDVIVSFNNNSEIVGLSFTDMITGIPAPKVF